LASVIDPEFLTIVRRYLAVLREENVHYESAWLFGSWAAGRQRPDSDIDVAVVMSHVESRFDQELELMRYRLKVDLRIEPHVLDSADLDNPFADEILKTGVPIQ
jgi:uncharacterized protein